MGQSVSCGCVRRRGSGFESRMLSFWWKLVGMGSCKRLEGQICGRVLWLSVKGGLKRPSWCRLSVLKNQFLKTK